MKSLFFPVLLAALLAGCSGTPSKVASIEDRSVTATETKFVADKPLVETMGKPPDATSTSSSLPLPAAGRSGVAVETRGLVAPSTDVMGLAEAKAAEAAAKAADTGATAKSGGVQDAAILPYSGGMNQADMKDPASLLSKRRVQFDYDSAAIRDEFHAMLEAHAKYMKTNSSARAILQGNTDERGSREYNLALGQRRAESVFKALNLLGVPEGQMEAVSMGEEKPLSEGHDEAAWQQNRRTEILYQGE